MKNISKPTFFTTISLLFNFLLITIVIIHIKSESKIAYVNNVKVFENFNMTKELKKIGEKEFKIRKSNLDDLYANLNSSGISITEKQKLMQQFIKDKEQLNQFNDVFGSEQSAKIWTRIKSYSSDFSKEKNYTVLLGSDSNDNILFAAETIDVTNDLIIYLNKKYEGLN